MKTALRIMTRDFTLLDEISLYESMQITRSWHGIGVLELRVNRYLKGADKLLRGNLVFPHNRLDNAYQIRHREIELDENGKVTENWIIRALSLKSWLAQRITYPPIHTSNDNKQADAETVMQHYVTNNLINPAVVDRAMPDVVLDTNFNRGETISWQSRYKNLAEEIASISALSGLGWNVEINKADNNYKLTVLEGRDLTANQNGRPQAIFSPEFNTLKQLSYLESDINYQNIAIVAGQGEGVDRRIVEVGQSVGTDRYELFVDARDIDEATGDEEPVPRPPAEIEADLINRGNQKLTEYEQEIYLEGQALVIAKDRKVERSLEQGMKLDDGINVIQAGDHIQLKSMDSYFLSPYQPIGAVVGGANTITVDVSKLVRYTFSKMTYTANTPPGTSIIVQYSADKQDWTNVPNGGSLPIERDTWLTGKKIYIRQLFFTTSVDVNPTLTSFNLIMRGYKTLPEQVFSAGELEYGKDFDLGDIVTLQHKDWGVTLDARITEVKEIYEPSGSHLELTFGNDRPDLISKIKQELSGIRAELTK